MSWKTRKKSCVVMASEPFLGLPLTIFAVDSAWGTFYFFSNVSQLCWEFVNLLHISTLTYFTYCEYFIWGILLAKMFVQMFHVDIFISAEWKEDINDMELKYIDQLRNWEHIIREDTAMRGTTVQDVLYCLHYCTSIQSSQKEFT